MYWCVCPAVLLCFVVFVVAVVVTRKPGKFARKTWKIMEKAEEKLEKLNQVSVEIEFCNVCNSKPQCLELSRVIGERVPGAQVTCKTGRRGSFEVQINETLVHSKLASLAFPDYEEVVSNVIAAKEGRPVTKVKEQPITDCVLQ